jgi:hypothetical protein
MYTWYSISAIFSLIWHCGHGYIELHESASHSSEISLEVHRKTNGKAWRYGRARVRRGGGLLVAMHSAVMTFEVMLSAEATAACGTPERFRFSLIVGLQVGLEVELALRGYSSKKSEPIANSDKSLAYRTGRVGI